MHAVLIGASKGIGYMILLSLLSLPSTSGSGEWSTTLLLRKPELLDDDEKLKSFLSAGRIKVVKGDATDETAVRRCFEGQQVDLVVTSIGATPSFTLRGIKIDQPDLCTRGALALLHVLAELDAAGKGPMPKIVAVSSMGLAENHHDMPTVMQCLYSWLLAKPHQDKLALEYLLQRASSALPTPTHKSAIPDPSILSPSATETVRENFIPEITILRPAMFTGDAEPRPTDKLKIGEKVAVYSVKRSEVARFAVDDVIVGRQWINKFPVIGA